MPFVLNATVVFPDPTFALCIKMYLGIRHVQVCRGPSHLSEGFCSCAVRLCATRTNSIRYARWAPGEASTIDRVRAALVATAAAVSQPRVQLLNRRVPNLPRLPALNQAWARTALTLFNEGVYRSRPPDARGRGRRAQPGGFVWV